MSQQRPPAALTIAGSDSSGGAGIQADLKTFSALGVYGASAITALTAQNTLGVTGIEAVTPQFVVAQIDAVLSDLQIGAIKTGMLASAAIVSAVAARLVGASEIPIVVDPVMISTSGHALLPGDAIAAVIRDLLPRAALVTPNLPEAARLLGVAEAITETEMADQARALHRLGAAAVLVKGGHGGGRQSIDILFDGVTVTPFAAPRVDTRNTHGTGCTLSAAIAALLAHGVALPEAVGRAKSYVSTALAAGAGLQIGSGHGPVDHLFDIRRRPLPV